MRLNRAPVSEVIGQKTENYIWNLSLPPPHTPHPLTTMNFTTLLFLLITIILSITPILADPDQDLLKSVHQGNIPGIKAAVLAGAMVNKRGSGGQTPLMAATLAGQTEVVRHLLDVHHANPAIPEKDGYTPMHGCCFQGRAEVGDKRSDELMDFYCPIVSAIFVCCVSTIFIYNKSNAATSLLRLRSAKS